MNYIPFSNRRDKLWQLIDACAIFHEKYGNMTSNISLYFGVQVLKAQTIAWSDPRRTSTLSFAHQRALPAPFISANQFLIVSTKTKSKARKLMWTCTELFYGFHPPLQFICYRNLGKIWNQNHILEY